MIAADRRPASSESDMGRGWGGSRRIAGSCKSPRGSRERRRSTSEGSLFRSPAVTVTEESLIRSPTQAVTEESLFRSPTVTEQLGLPRTPSRAPHRRKAPAPGLLSLTAGRVPALPARRPAPSSPPARSLAPQVPSALLAPSIPQGLRACQPHAPGPGTRIQLEGTPSTPGPPLASGVLWQPFRSMRGNTKYRLARGGRGGGEGVLGFESWPRLERLRARPAPGP